MIPFEGVLGEGDLLHLRAIQGGPPRTALRERVVRFLRESSFAAEDAAEAFRSLPRAERERVISELVWRITCYLDGSVTRVRGVDTFDLGAGFCAVLSEIEGREVFCLSIAKGA